MLKHVKTKAAVLHCRGFLKIHNKDEITDDDIANALNLYKNVENMNSSDIINVMGMIYKKE